MATMAACMRVCMLPLSPVLWLVASAVGEGTVGWVGTGHAPSRTKYESREERGLPSSVSQVGKTECKLVLPLGLLTWELGQGSIIFNAESSACFKHAKEEEWVGEKGAGLSSRKLVS